MFPLAGGVCFTGCIILATYNRLVGFNKTSELNEEKCNKTRENNGKIVRIPYPVEEITESMLNNPNDPKYIGHLFNFGKGGAEYNL